MIAWLASIAVLFSSTLPPSDCGSSGKSKRGDFVFYCEMGVAEETAPSLEIVINESLK